MKKIFVALLLLITFKGFSQTRAMDSLKKLIGSDKKDDSVKVKTLYECSFYLYWAAYSSPQPDYSKVIYYLRAGLQLANKINRPDLASDGYIWLGEIYGTENMRDSSIAVLLEGLSASERSGLKDKLPEFYHSLGESYRLSHQLTLAEYYDRKFYNVVSMQKNDKLMLTALGLFISLNDQKGNPDTVRILVDKSLAIATRLNDRPSLNRLFMQKGKMYQSQNKSPEAVNAYHESARYRIAHNLANDTYLLTQFSESFLGI